ncbi:MAG: VWA domain-containing protein [Gammaproteobacteria bacterium]|nr:VWA domain-containing protein [Gammaproteobacteria bacterium]
MNYGLATPWALALLPLALLPLLRHGQQTLGYSSLAMLPRDGLSDLVDGLVRVVAMAAVIAMVFGIGGLFRAAESVERIGQGAQTVMLLDSSGSMDTAYATGTANTSRAAVWGTYLSKGQVARRMLAEYAAQRPQDMFALFVFSGNPIPVLSLTEKQSAIQAAIAAGGIERGLASTDLGTGLIRSLEYFKDQPFTGSRVVMLVSDGAASLTIPVQDEIRNLLRKYRVSLYWFYLRAQFSPGLDTKMSSDTASQIAPEQLVHKFFAGTGVPYRAYSAENPNALREAIAEVNKLQNLPIRYQDVIPRRDLSARCFGVALALMAVLLAAKCTELERWH